ncbi:izumo sperm-egg fusion protein 1 isoform X2 [Megalops cyprinoides]|nr:izumo sperm-egg fusion protein 1 isoform X2 [Megalops cyprinoides]
MVASSSTSVEDQIELKKIFDHTYFRYLQTSQRFHGVIDPTTLYRVRTEYQSEFHKWLKRPFIDDMLFETVQIMEKGIAILQKHLEIFSRTGLCPNKCGLLYQRVMDCSTCQYRMHTCLSPADQRSCGVQHLEAEEGDQVALDCFLPWHSLVMGRKDYQYSRTPGLSSCQSNDSTVLVVTPDSTIILNQLRKDEQGVYRCLLLDSDGTVLSCIHYVLTVTPLPLTTQKPVVILPTLPPDDINVPPVQQAPRSVLWGIVVAVTALSIIASIAIIAIFGVTLKRQREEAMCHRQGQEVEMTEVSTLRE